MLLFFITLDRLVMITEIKKIPLVSLSCTKRIIQLCKIATYSLNFKTWKKFKFYLKTVTMARWQIWKDRIDEYIDKLQN